MTMRFLTTFTVLVVSIKGQSDVGNHNYFNYDKTDISEGGYPDYGQPDWDKVVCKTDSVCTGFPNKYPYAFGWGTSTGGNNCQWCPTGYGKTCGIHKQSPIDVQRFVGIIGDPNENECKDWHHMSYYDGTCSWDDMKNHFTIERHALQMHIPQRSDGQIDCIQNGERLYPKLDYSKGFNTWWWLQRMDITTPSQHKQESKRYDAELTLAHFYSIEHIKNQEGHVTIFLDGYDNVESWPYLDKLICAWRHAEEKVRAACGLDPSPPYGRCQLFRGQEPTQEWLVEAGLAPSGATFSPAPTDYPTEAYQDSASPSASSSTGSPTKISQQAGDNSSPSTPPVASDKGDVASDVPSKNPTTSPSQKPAYVIDQTGNADSSSSPTTGGLIPSLIDCAEYRDPANFHRMCRGHCCDYERSDSNYCWDLYENVFTEENIYSACYHCCKEEYGQPLVIGPPAPESTTLGPKTIKCSDVNAQRICKPDGCCTNPRSTSSWCQSQYDLFGDDMYQICHYCCVGSPDIGSPSRRNLRIGSNHTSSLVDHRSDMVSEANDEDEIDDDPLLDEFNLPEGYKLIYSGDRKFVLNPKDFEEKIDDFDERYAAFEHSTARHLAGLIHDEDYADVDYWPYQAMLKVSTEYYFRYEGTQVVPPCRQTVHWRVMKDPIRVHPRQITELQRLLAWRVSSQGEPNQCNVDTAGRLSADGNSVDVSRHVQYLFNTQHRMVFCECKDWPSRFPNDKRWCENWKLDTNYTRFYEHPYNFRTDDGQW